jgi:hypothetical protein
VVQYLILVWSVHTYILRRAVVGNLSIKVMGMNVIS